MKTKWGWCNRDKGTSGSTSSSPRSTRTAWNTSSCTRWRTCWSAVMATASRASWTSCCLTGGLGAMRSIARRWRLRIGSSSDRSATFSRSSATCPPDDSHADLRGRVGARPSWPGPDFGATPGGGLGATEWAPGAVDPARTTDIAPPATPEPTGPTPTRARQHCHSRGALRLSFYRRSTLNDDAISEPDRWAAGPRDVPQGLLPPRVSPAARLRCPGGGTEPADG